MIEVPGRFAREIAEREGDHGRTWIATLPELAEGFFKDWECTPDGAAVSGRVGIVIPVSRAGRTPAVLKISFPHPGNVDEPHALAAWQGRGAVRLLERDDAHFAMLLERGGPATLAELGDDDEAVAVCGRLARRLAVPAPPALRRLSDRAGSWAEELIEDARTLDHRVPQRIIDTAVANIRELGADQPETVVHGDLHYRNVITGEREPWIVIDPKGFAGDPAYDARSVLAGGLAGLIASGDLESLLRRRLAIFADAAEISRERVHRWVQARALIAAYEFRRSPRLERDTDSLIPLCEEIAEVLA